LLILVLSSLINIGYVYQIKFKFESSKTIQNLGNLASNLNKLSILLTSDYISLKSESSLTFNFTVISTALSELNNSQGILFAEYPNLYSCPTTSTILDTKSVLWNFQPNTTAQNANLYDLIDKIYNAVSVI
jgi:hypothetical protein